MHGIEYTSPLRPPYHPLGVRVGWGWGGGGGKGLAKGKGEGGGLIGKTCRPLTYTYYIYIYIYDGFMVRA